MCEARCKDHGSRCVIGPPYHGWHHAEDGCYWADASARPLPQGVEA